MYTTSSQSDYKTDLSLLSIDNLQQSAICSVNTYTPSFTATKPFLYCEPVQYCLKNSISLQMAARIADLLAS